MVGNPAFEVTEGEVIFNGKNLLDLSPGDRSREGIFLSFQYPVEIPGVSMVNFMRAALNEHRKYVSSASCSLFSTVTDEVLLATSFTFVAVAFTTYPVVL